jgi:hypothetical protein
MGSLESDGQQPRLKSVNEERFAMDRLLPADLIGRAFSASNGELAWSRQDAVRAAQLIAGSGWAILGGEAWLIGENGSWQGAIPDRAGGPDGVWTWAPDPGGLEDGETWEDFCRRCLLYILRVLETIEAEDSADPSCRDRIRYNLTYVSEHGYEDLLRH